MRDLDQKSGTVSGLRIATASTAMRQINEYLNALQDDIVGFLSFDVGDKSDAAVIMLLLRMVESLSVRQSPKWIRLGILPLVSHSQSRLAGTRTPVS
jgi:hypothetical protein